MTEVGDSGHEFGAVYAEAAAWYGEHWDPDRRLGEWWDLLAESGWAFPSWPEGFGGRGLSDGAARQAERARREAGALGSPKGTATFLAAPTLFTYGSSEQLDRYIPGIVRGRDVWCQLFSEPGSGSDLAGLSTRAERDGDEWVITGQKVWNSGAQHARYGILMARSDPGQPKHRGITYFLVDMEQPGVETRPLREMTGEVAFSEVFLSEARVPDRDRLGGVGEGWGVAMTTLSHERAMATQSREGDPDSAETGDGVAFTRPDLGASVKDYAAELASSFDGFALVTSGGADRVLDRVVEDTGAGADPLMRQELMALLTMRRTAGWSDDRARAAVKAGGQPGPEVSTLKLLTADIARRGRDIGLQALGPTGMLWGEDTPGGGLFHSYAIFTPALSIAGGSDEINRNVIGERVLGLPREPGEAELRERPWSELPRN